MERCSYGPSSSSRARGGDHRSPPSISCEASSGRQSFAPKHVCGRFGIESSSTTRTVTSSPTSSTTRSACSRDGASRRGSGSSRSRRPTRRRPVLLDAVVDRLRQAGAGAPDPTPKYIRALGARASQAPEVPVRGPRLWRNGGRRRSPRDRIVRRPPLRARPRRPARLRSRGCAPGTRRNSAPALGSQDVSLSRRSGVGHGAAGRARMARGNPRRSARRGRSARADARSRSRAPGDERAGCGTSPRDAGRGARYGTRRASRERAQRALPRASRPARDGGERTGAAPRSGSPGRDCHPRSRPQALAISGKAREGTRRSLRRTRSCTTSGSEPSACDTRPRRWHRFSAGRRGGSLPPLRTCRRCSAS